jgi:hypothetical protein
MAEAGVSSVPLPNAPEEFWNGPRPPYAFTPASSASFWSRPSTWIITATLMLGFTIVYFIISAAGSAASAPGGCGGG